MLQNMETTNIFNKREIMEEEDYHQKSEHSEDKRFLCDLCTSSFLRKDGLLRHEKIHTGEKPFACETCNKAFSTKESLKKHKLVHSGIKSFQCDRCPKGFFTNGDLKQHLFKAHKIIPQKTKSEHIKMTLTCDKCDYKTKKKSNLQRHRAYRHEGVRWACDKCDHTASSKQNLKKHIYATHEQAENEDIPNETNYFEFITVESNDSDFMKGKLELSKAIQDLHELSYILQSFDFPKNVLQLKLRKIKAATETTKFLLNSINDILGRNIINLKTDPADEKDDTFSHIIDDENSNHEEMQEQISFLDVEIKSDEMNQENSFEETTESNVLFPNKAGVKEEYFQNEIKEDNFNEDILSKLNTVPKYRFQCWLCDYRTNRKSNFDSHCGRLHGDKGAQRVSCTRTWCDHKFSTEYDRKVHTKQCFLVCAICLKKYDRQDHYDAHMKAETNAAYKKDSCKIIHCL